MKLKLAVFVFGAMALASCKKDYECECTTVFYDASGIYAGTNDELKYKVGSKSECDSYNKSTATEVTNCYFDAD